MMDIDSVFYDRFGAESLSQLTAVLHRGYYKVLLFFLQCIHFRLMEVFIYFNLTRIQWDAFFVCHLVTYYRPTMCYAVIFVSFCLIFWSATALTARTSISCSFQSLSILCFLRIQKGISFHMSVGPRPRPSSLMMKETTITLRLCWVDTWRTCTS